MASRLRDVLVRSTGGAPAGWSPAVLILLLVGALVAATIASLVLTGAVRPAPEPALQRWGAFAVDRPAPTAEMIALPGAAQLGDDESVEFEDFVGSVVTILVPGTAGDAPADELATFAAARARTDERVLFFVGARSPSGARRPRRRRRGDGARDRRDRPVRRRGWGRGLPGRQRRACRRRPGRDRGGRVRRDDARPRRAGRTAEPIGGGTMSPRIRWLLVVTIAGVLAGCSPTTTPSPAASARSTASPTSASAGAEPDRRAERERRGSDAIGFTRGPATGQRARDARPGAVRRRGARPPVLADGRRQPLGVPRDRPGRHRPAGGGHRHGQDEADPGDHRDRRPRRRDRGRARSSRTRSTGTRRMRPETCGTSARTRRSTRRARSSARRARGRPVSTAPSRGSSCRRIPRSA